MTKGKTRVCVEIEFDVEWTICPGRKATPPSYSHGGLPAEEPEIEIQDVRYVSGLNSTLALPDDVAISLIDREGDNMLAQIEEDIDGGALEPDWDQIAEDRRERAE